MSTNTEVEDILHSLERSKFELDNDVVDLNKDDSSDFHELFPRKIPHYPIRRDHYTHDIVSHGRIELLGGLDAVFNRSSRISLDEFRKALQCAPSEPDLNGKRGSLNLLKIVKPTRETVEILCAWLLEKCHHWKDCHENLDTIKQTKYNVYHHIKNNVRLFRVMNDGRFYFDWPWEMDETTPKLQPPYLMSFVLERVHGMKDMVFFHGEEGGALEYNIPFPAFGQGVSLLNMDMPWPWSRPTRFQVDTHRNFVNSHHSFEDEDKFQRIMHGEHFKEWGDRHSKAVFYASMTWNRQIFFDAALTRPDLFVAKFAGPGGAPISPWNPSSDEQPWTHGDAYVMEMIRNMTQNITDQDMRKHIGYTYPLLRGYLHDREAYHVGEYKYTVVIQGPGAPTDRLLDMLVHSGSVVLLQESHFEYHFTSRLKPWVHYVPLSYNCADAIEKVEWLVANDHLAQKIVQNARNFGRSYLRVEDHFCYAATAMEEVGSVLEGSDALIPFSNAVEVRYPF